MQVRNAMALLALAMPVMLWSSVWSMEPEPVNATWKQSEIDFVYLGRTSFYSCDSLRDRIERVLEELGARDDLVVRASGCMSQISAEAFTTVRIRVTTPVLVDPDAALKADEKSRRELVARVRGESNADAEVIDQFPAAWTRVRFTDRSRIVDDGDCELLEQLEARVFPKLGIHVVKDRNSCVPGQVRHGQLDLEVEALKALPSADDAR